MEENSNNNIPNLTETDLFKFLDKFKLPIIIIGLIGVLVILRPGIVRINIGA